MTLVTLDIGMVAYDETSDYLRYWKYPTGHHANICSFFIHINFRTGGGRQANISVGGDERKKIANFISRK